MCNVRSGSTAVRQSVGVYPMKIIMIQFFVNGGLYTKEQGFTMKMALISFNGQCAACWYRRMASDVRTMNAALKTAVFMFAAR